MSTEILERGIRIDDLEVPHPEVAEYLAAIPVEDRDTAVVAALRVGVLCLERARTIHDVEFVRRQVESMLHEVTETARAIPGTIQAELMKKIGAGDGQVLAPIQATIAKAEGTLNRRLDEVNKLLAEDIDPTRETSAVGRALRVIRDLLDPRRVDSIQGVLNEAVRNVTNADGPLTKTVKGLVEDAVRPLAEEVNRLAKDIHAQQAVAEALDHTTAKGLPYEEEVVQVLQRWARAVGAEVQHVGGDKQPGDVVVTVTESSIAGTACRIVIERRGTAMTPSVISRSLTPWQRQSRSGVP